LADCDSDVLAVVCGVSRLASRLRHNHGGSLGVGRLSFAGCCLFVLVSLTAIGCGGFTTPPPEGAAEGAAEEPAPEILGDCRDDMRSTAGEGCRYSGGGRHRAEVVLSVSRDGLICREGGPAQHQDLQFDNLRICRDDAFVRDDTFESSILVERGRDGSWAFYSSAAALQTAQP